MPMTLEAWITRGCSSSSSPSLAAALVASEKWTSSVSSRVLASFER